MTPETVQSEKKKGIQILSWVLIIISVIGLLRNTLYSFGYSEMVHMLSLSKKYNPPLEFNFNLYLFVIQTLIGVILNVAVIVSAIFIMKYKNIWRRVLIYSLILSTIFLLIVPIVEYINWPLFESYLFNQQQHVVETFRTSKLIGSYVWSITLSTILIFITLRLFNPKFKAIFN